MNSRVISKLSLKYSIEGTAIIFFFSVGGGGSKLEFMLHWDKSTISLVLCTPKEQKLISSLFIDCGPLSPSWMPSFAFFANRHFVYQIGQWKQKKKKKTREKKVASSRRLTDSRPVSRPYPVSNPVQQGLTWVHTEFRDSLAAHKSNLSATPSTARGCETGISSSINNLILNVIISRPIKTYS